MSRIKVIRRSEWVEIRIMENGSNELLFKGKAQLSDGEGMRALMSAARSKGFDWTVKDGWWE